MTQALRTRPTRVLASGEKVQLTDPKGRMHTLVLPPGELLHAGEVVVAHVEISGRPEGMIAANAGGEAVRGLRPRYEDCVLSMPGGAAVVYPKDSGLMVTVGDMHPGATVVEAGVGSG